MMSAAGESAGGLVQTSTGGLGGLGGDTFQVRGIDCLWVDGHCLREQALAVRRDQLGAVLAS